MVCLAEKRSNLLIRLHILSPIRGRALKLVYAINMSFSVEEDFKRKGVKSKIQQLGKT